MSRKFFSKVGNALAGFIPASATVMVGIFAVLAFTSRVGLPRTIFLVGGIFVLLLSAGYVLTACCLPARANARVTRLAHAVAGAAATMLYGVLASTVPRHGQTIAITLLVAAGTFVGLVQWVRSHRNPRPPSRSLEELEAEADEALSRALAAAQTSRDVIPIERPERSPDRPKLHVA